MSMRPPPVDLHTFLTQWLLTPFPCAVLVVLTLAGMWYVQATRDLAERGRRWSPWRTVSFVAGLAGVELALQSAVAVLAMSSFTAHIVQHLLLMVVAPPLLALGAPMTLALQTSSRPVKRRLLRMVHSFPFAVITHPVVVWFLYYASMYAFFLSHALQYAMFHIPVMDLINVGFLLGATLFWWPMVGLDPIPRWRMGYGLRFLNLLIGIPVESFLGIALLTKTTPVAYQYTTSGTHVGGGVLWGATELATVIALVPLFSQWAASDLREGDRINRRLEAAATGGSTAPEVDGEEAPEGRGLAHNLRSLRRG